MLNICKILQFLRLFVCLRDLLSCSVPEETENTEFWFAWGGDQYPDRYYIDITLSFEKHWVLQKDIPHWATPHTLFDMNCQNFGCTIKWHIQNPIKHLRWSVFFLKKNSYRLKQLSTKSRKCSILDVSQGSEYASAITFQTNKKNNS